MKNPTSSVVFEPAWREGRERLIDQATILPSNGTTYGSGTPPAMTWNPVTCPSTRQGTTSTLLTILPGQDGFGELSVWPRMITRAGAESAASGRAKATSAANAQARHSAAAARLRCFRLSVAVSKDSSATLLRSQGCGPDSAWTQAELPAGGRICTIPARRARQAVD